MDGFLAWVDQAIVNMRAAGNSDGAHVAAARSAHRRGRRTKRFLQTGGKLSGGGFRDERARMRAAYVAAIGDRLVPAYARLRDFIRGEYLPACRNTDGLGALPNGKAWYAESLPVGRAKGFLRGPVPTFLPTQRRIVACDMLESRIDAWIKIDAK
jgi:uncharacterized protein (DUF885 family)